MKTFESITGFKPPTYKGRLITFGLTEDENNFLKILFHSKDIEIYDADIASDLVALFATATIVNASKLDPDDFALLENYYKEVGTEADEIVFWLGSPKPAIELQVLFKCFDSLEEIVPTITKILNTKV
mgnify:FL=1